MPKSHRPHRGHIAAANSRASICGLALIAGAVVLTPAALRSQSARFERGDANADTAIDISDPINTLAYLFSEDVDSVPCEDAADANDSGDIDLSDAIFTLNFLFVAGAEPPAPYEVCGADPTDDNLSCAEFAPCPPPTIDAFVVNSTADLVDARPGDGTCDTGNLIALGEEIVPECTLRAALDEANALEGTNEIEFHKALTPDENGGIRFTPKEQLSITDPLILDGYTASGYDTESPAQNPVVHLYGAFGVTGVSGLLISPDARGTIVRGVAIHGFPRHGMYILADDVIVQGCHIGLRDGAIVDGNIIDGIFVDGATRLAIGMSIANDGALLGRPNVISGNGAFGLRMNEGGSVVVGNLIGVEVSGRAAESVGSATGNRDGVYLSDDNFSQTLVSHNVISGNLQQGVEIEGALGHKIVNNYIGTSIDGDAGLGGLGNGCHGVYIFESSELEISGNVVSGNGCGGISIDRAANTEVAGNRIGVTADGASVLANDHYGIYVFSRSGAYIIRDNVIGGNGATGLLLEAAEVQVTGNWIGTNDAGANLGNQGSGIEFLTTEGQILRGGRIGGPEPDDGNIIGFNAQSGIALTADVETVQIFGNHIGTDASGRDLGNGEHGIILGGNAHTLGSADAPNVIGFNDGDGVHVRGDRHRIIGNYIGTNDRAEDLGNDGDGIELATRPLNGVGSSGNVIGAALSTPEELVAEQGNTIAYNAGQGIELAASIPILAEVKENCLRANSIYANGSIGIDLAPIGLTANDPDDADTGTNGGQNTPVLDPAPFWNETGGTLFIHFTVPSAPTESSYPLHVDFYLADADAEEGKTYIGTAMYEERDAGSQVTTQLEAPPELEVNSRLVATATDSAGSGNTSEFSASIAVASR